MPVIEAILRAQEGSALRGNPYAQKQFIERYHWAEREQRLQRLEQIEHWKAYVDRESQAIVDAKAKGEVPPSLLPHPEDVIIDYEKGVRFAGPINEEDVARMEQTLKYRDVLLLQDALDQREVGNVNSEDVFDRPGSALALARILNRCIPERLRLSDNQILFRMDRNDVMPKRALLKELHRAWRSIGVPMRRGFTFPPARFAKELVEEVRKLLDNIRDSN